MTTQDDNFDGCGISKIWLTSPDDVFAKACKFHDEAYIVNSVWQHYYTRKEIDKTFLSIMLGAVEEIKGSLLLKAKAYFYYYLARALGAKYWEGKK